ncbi:unnamed protein product [Urochloa humidicola]
MEEVGREGGEEVVGKELGEEEAKNEKDAARDVKPPSGTTMPSVPRRPRPVATVGGHEDDTVNKSEMPRSTTPTTTPWSRTPSSSRRPRRSCRHVRGYRELAGHALGHKPEPLHRPCTASPLPAPR